MPLDVPARALESGFSNGPGSAHNSRTIMLAELRAVLSAVPEDGTAAEYTDAIIRDDVTSKATGATREKTVRYLRELYGLDRGIPVFAALREVWSPDPVSQPMIALLCALARDRALRATAETVLALRSGDAIDADALAAAVEESLPGRYNDDVRSRVGRNTASSWTQAGLLVGRSSKTRSHPEATVPAVAYALYLGHLEGRAGLALFDTLWTRVLDTPPATLQALAETAAHAGWLDLRSAGGMVQITFSHLDGLTGWGAA